MSATRELDEIVRQAHSARSALRQARLRLAEQARGGAPTALLDPSWDWARRILAVRAQRLRAFPGVVGYALGDKLRAGVATGEPCLVVYVRRKLDAAELHARAWRALPTKVGTGPRAIAVDVVGLGDLERHAPSHAPAFDAPRSSARRPSVISSNSARTAAMLMARLVAGEPVAVPGVGRVRGWRPVLFPADTGTAVRLAGLASGLQFGVLAAPMVHLPGWGLDTAMLAHVHSAPGDSGSVLVDEDGLALGFLVGRATGAGEGWRVFRPAAALAEAALAASLEGAAAAATCA